MRRLIDSLACRVFDGSYMGQPYPDPVTLLQLEHAACPRIFEPMRQELMKRGNLQYFLRRCEAIRNMCIMSQCTPTHWFEMAKLRRVERYANLLKKEGSTCAPVPSFLRPHCSANWAHMIEHLRVFESWGTLSQYRTIVDWGAGYGAMAKVMLLGGYNGYLKLVDCRMMNLLQEYYLSNSAMPGSCMQRVEFVENYERIGRADSTLFWSTYALTEADEDTRERAAATLDRYATIFLAYRRQFGDFNTGLWARDLSVKLQDTHLSLIHI